MMRIRFLLVPSLVLVAAALRLLSNSSSPVRFPDELPRSAIQSVALKNQPSSFVGITRIEYQRFDPDAVFVVQSGPDLMPGVAGIDDNLNGIIDDRLELGATRSDDVCKVLTADQLKQLSGDQAMVLQQGAFVQSNGATENNRRRSRAVVFGNSRDGKHWSFIRDLPL